MSLNGTVTTYDIDPPKIYDDPCVVQQHDGKLLILGKYGIAVLVFIYIYRKVASSIPVYYSIFDYFGGAIY